MSHDYNTSIDLSWQDVHRDTRLLAEKLKEKGPFKGLIAVTRGGLVPAALLSRLLDIRLVDTICIATYEGQNKGEQSVLKMVEGDGEGWLIVDDLVDTGVTARAIRALMPKAYYATVYAKPIGRPLADMVITEVGQNVWINFPWE